MRVLAWFCGALMVAAGGWQVGAAETVRIDPAKVAQLRRLEPLTPEKLQIFQDSGQLSAAQVEMVRRYISRDGLLALPDDVVGAERAVPYASDPAAPATVAAAVSAPRGQDVPRRQDGAIDVLAWLRADDERATPHLAEADKARLEERIRAFRRAGHATRANIKEELRAAIPAVNALIAAAYTDPIDLDIKEELWATVARRENTYAAGYIARTHQEAVQAAHPVLIPYAKDVGGLLVRRKGGGEEPLQRWYPSRDLRELILDLEKSIATCSGARAVSYLADVYATRYAGAEAPMRDENRDRRRLAEACGGDKKKFDEDEQETWRSTLAPAERAVCAERLIPLLRDPERDVRRIAEDGLLVLLDNGSKRLKDLLEKAHDDWREFASWWERRREELLAGKR